MAQVAQIVLADAQATPVNHTFIPLGPDANNVWWFEDQVATAPSPLGYNRLSVSLVRPTGMSVGTSSQDRLARVKMSIHLPVLETLGNNSAGIVPAPTVAYIPRLNIEYILPERSTLQNRKDLRKFALGLLADVQVVAAVEALQSIY